MASSVNLLALAARVESEGRYNVAKLLRAAVVARGQREADQALEEAPRGDELLEALHGVADAFATDPLLVPLSEPLRAGTRAFAAGAVPLIDEVPDPLVCRRCGHVAMAEAPEACPRCAADGVTFLVQRPVWWLERYDPASAMAQLERTPARVRALLDRIPVSAWSQRPEPGTWSPHEVLSHVRDAQGVLEQRVAAILEHDDPDLEAKMVWSWNQEARPATTQEVLDAYLASRARVLEVLRGAPADAWWRTGRHREFGRLTLTQQVSYFAAHEPTHLRQLRSAARG
ncbi:MAG: DinB family protein [Trueperaceae bacterium]